MSDNGWNAWTLDDPEAGRQRFTKSGVQRGQTEHIQCRADAFHVRRVDEIVASRIDPSLKTRSDVIQDALALWLEDWDKRYPDGSGGELGYQYRLDRMERKSRFRSEFLESAKNQLDRIRNEGDIQHLGEFLQIMLQAEGDFKDDSPPSYMGRVQDLIQEAHRLLDASKRSL